MIIVTPPVFIALAWWDIFGGSESRPLEVDKWFARIKKM